MELLAQHDAVRYGERFRQVRIAKDLKQVHVQARLKLKGQGTVSLIESSKHDPTAATVLKHARALECLPSELLKDVETTYDRIRAGEYDNQPRAQKPVRLIRTPQKRTAKRG